MFGDITTNEIELLNAYNLLSTPAQSELRDYLRYQLCKQYRKEVMLAVFNNQLIHSLLHSLLHLVERDEFDINQVQKRVLQIKELYFGIFEQIHCKYSERIEELDSNEVVKDFGRDSFANIANACHSGNRIAIRLEIVELYEGYNKLARKKDARKIVAV